ncbi:hypothetical protein EV384_0752 [Micromonospora kangleipakensis]|uniref:Uncharacterized protein n=1 Tax=Micromonospora kangleipakensis TaxID=1077942 RepID=A0A4Q8B5S6_9ACTN|nr:hypothetical protein EV384_0752 [Micromonospora kangleipakensis]
MVDGGISTTRTEDEAAAAGDERAFARVTERHRGELRVHCCPTSACPPSCERRAGQPISGNQPAASPSSSRSRSVSGTRPAAWSR